MTFKGMLESISVRLLWLKRNSSAAVSFSCCCTSTVGANVQVAGLGAALEDVLELDDDVELKLGCTELELGATELELDGAELDEDTVPGKDAVLEGDTEIDGETGAVDEAGVLVRAEDGDGLAS